MKSRTTLLSIFGLGLLVGWGGAASAHLPMPPRTQVDVALVCDGRPCEEVSHRGQRYVIGEYGARYTIALTNRSDRWVEAVVHVDGRSVLDGRPVSTRNRGYLLPPRERIEVEGWRTSTSHVAAFRFTSIGDSYAGRMGDASQAGTIRLDVFPERRSTVWVPPPRRPVTLEDGPPSGPRGAAEKRDRGAATSESRPWHDDDGGHLGTQYGESRWQPVAERSFERADPHRPAVTLVLRYDDRAGLIERGVLPRRWVDDDDRWVPPPPRRWIDDEDDRWTPAPPR